MVLTWILIGFVAGCAASAIINWWNEIVEWTENVFKRISEKVSKAWAYLSKKGNELKVFIMELFSNGDTKITEGPKTVIIKTKEQLVELADKGCIPHEAVDMLWTGKPFTITINSK